MLDVCLGLRCVAREGKEQAEAVPIAEGLAGNVYPPATPWSKPDGVGLTPGPVRLGRWVVGVWVRKGFLGLIFFRKYFYMLNLV